MERLVSKLNHELFKQIFKFDGLYHFFNYMILRFSKAYNLPLICEDWISCEEFDALKINKIWIFANNNFISKNLDNLTNLDLSNAYINCGIFNKVPLGPKEYEEKGGNLSYYKILKIKNKVNFQNFNIHLDVGEIIDENKFQLVKKIGYKFDYQFLYSKKLVDASPFFKSLLYQKNWMCEKYKDKEEQATIKTALLALIGCFGSDKPFLKGKHNVWLASFIWTKNMCNLFNIYEKTIKQYKDAKLLLVKTDSLTFLNVDSICCDLPCKIKKYKYGIIINSANYVFEYDDEKKVVTNFYKLYQREERLNLKVNNFFNEYVEHNIDFSPICKFCI